MFCNPPFFVLIYWPLHCLSSSMYGFFKLVLQNSDFNRILPKLIKLPKTCQFWSTCNTFVFNQVFTPVHCYNDFDCNFKLYGNSLESNELLKYGIKVSITNYCECECLKFHGCDFLWFFEKRVFSLVTKIRRFHIRKMKSYILYL